MMKFFWSLGVGRESRPVWETDPLRHPEIAVMDQRELGDLPMVPAQRERPFLAACGEGKRVFRMAAKAA